MIKQTITYVDFEGVERTEDFHFHLSEAELTEMEVSEKGGFRKTIEAIVAAKDEKELIRIFKSVLVKSYGEKSMDGRRFVKSEELSKAFTETNAYSQLFMKLAFDDIDAAEFINGLAVTVGKK